MYLNCDFVVKEIVASQDCKMFSKENNIFEKLAFPIVLFRPYVSGLFFLSWMNVLIYACALLLSIIFFIYVKIWTTE